MNTGLNVNLHNKFDFVLTNKDTGEVTQRATGYNIILDQMWDRLCARKSFCTHIHFGTGSGALDPARKSLFTPLGSRAIDTVLRTYALPTSTWRTKIIINAEEFIGYKFSEVGIGYGTTNTYLVTHAMLEDSEGNELVINKTANDVLTIYATIYITIVLDSFQSISALDNNTLLKYLTGSTWTDSSNTCYLGTLPKHGQITPASGALENSTLGSVSVPISADIDNKRIKFVKTRFGIFDGNGNVRSVILSNLFNFSLPNSTYLGTFYEDVSLGSYDGTNRLKLPSGNIRDNSITGNFIFNTFKVPKLLAYNNNIGTWGENTQWILMSPNDSYLVARNAGTELKIFKKNDILFKSLALSQQPYAGIQHPVFSSDTKYMAVPSLTAESLTIYEIDNEEDTFTNIEITEMPPNRGTQITFNSDNDLMAITTLNNPSLTLYEINNGSFNKIIIDELPSNQGRTVAFNPDGTLLAVGTVTTPYLHLYRVEDKELYKLEIDELPTKEVNEVFFNKTGTLLAAQLNGTPYLEMYKVDGNDLIKLDTGITFPAAPESMQFSPNGKNLVFSTNNADDRFVLYDIEGTTFTKRSIDTQPLSQPKNLAFNKDGAQVGFVLYRDSPNVFIYNILDENVNLIQADRSLNYSSYLSKGPIWATFCNTENTMLGCTGYSSGNYQIFTYDSNTYETYVDIQDPPPALNEELKVSYTVDGIHKTNQYVLDVEGYIQLSGGN